MCHVSNGTHFKLAIHFIIMDALTPYIGEFGRWQFYIYMVCAAAGIPGAMQIYVMTFFTPNIDFWCARPQHIRDQIPVDVWRNYSSPLEVVKEEEIRSQCRVYDWDFDNANVTNFNDIDRNRTRECHEWEFDKGIYHRTMRDEFNLVCSRDILISTSNAIYMAAFMISVLINGHLADRYGRRKVILVNNLFLVIVSTVMIFSNSFTMFIALRGFQCFFSMGIGGPSFTLFTEVCSEKYRATLGNLFFWGFGLGIISFAGIAYGLLNWFYIQIVVTAPYILFFSPRWLIMQGRIEEAVLEIEKAAKTNRIEIPDSKTIGSSLRKLFSTKQNKVEKQHTTLDLLKYPNLRKKTFNMFYCWVVNAFVYYGLSFNTNDLGGNPFINFLISSAVEIPAYICAAIAVRYFGRRVPLTVVMIIAGLACATPIFIPSDMSTLSLVFTMAGKLCITASFGMIYVYAAELFPTVARNIGIGSCSMVARIGSILAPYVKELGIYTHIYVPPAIYGVLSISSGLFILLLPETKGMPIPDSIEEAETITRTTSHNVHTCTLFLTMHLRIGVPCRCTTHRNLPPYACLNSEVCSLTCRYFSYKTNLHLISERSARGYTAHSLIIMDALTPYIGEFGRWQFYIFMVCASSGIPGAMQIYVMTFFTPNLDFWCARPLHIRDQISVDVWRNYSSPLEVVKEEKIRSQCRVYDWDFDNANVTNFNDIDRNRTRECHEWEFDKGIYHRTMRDEFNLVCSRDILISTSNAIYMAVFMISVLINGHLADRYGRRKVILVNNLLLLIVSTVMIFSNSFTMFIALRGFQCFFLMGIGGPSFTLFTEVCSEKYRATLGNLFWGLGLGILSFAGIAYGLLNWVYIQIVVTAPYILFLSPRWLIMQGRIEEAVLEIEKAAKMNRIEIPDRKTIENSLQKLFSTEQNKVAKHYTTVDLLKYPSLRKKTFNMFYCWVVNAFVYYGISFNTNDLGGNPFINFLISSAVEIPAYIGAAIAVRYFGRRVPLTVVMIIAGLACATPIFIPSDMSTLSLVFTMAGKLCITASFAMIYVYAAELFPTVVRNIGIGSCSMVARIGSILAPYVKELVSHIQVIFKLFRHRRRLY
ncbi:Organic cation transporter protein [Nymphon striatum]|nr:Organic cation transporter protein [Nymphon striatum]